MRSEARVCAFKVIFSSLFEDNNQTKNAIMLESGLNANDTDFATTLIEAFEANKIAIENTIKNIVVGYEFDRIYNVDLALISLAVAEIQYVNTPKAVVINEVLEIAKKFSTENSQKFINGVLAKV